MFDQRTLKITAIILSVYIALWIPFWFWPGYLDSPFGLIAAIPFLSIYAFNGLGIPGLLQNNGLCGWGWCGPTLFGWVFIIVFWILVAWLLARLVAGPATPSATPGCLHAEDAAGDNEANG